MLYKRSKLLAIIFCLWVSAVFVLPSASKAEVLYGFTSFEVLFSTQSAGSAGINTAPRVTAPSSITVRKNIASPLFNISFADDDAVAASVVSTFNIATGTLSATGTSSITVGGTTSSLTLTGSFTDINSFIAAKKLNFTTAQDSETPETLTVSMNDQGNTGTGGAKDSGTTNIKIFVNGSDVDGDGDADANDGLMIQRRLTGAGTVTTGVVLPPNAGGTGTNGAKTDAEIISSMGNVGTGFDVDGDNDADANDGLMIQRRLTGAGTVTTGVVLPSNVGGSETNGAKTNAEVINGIDLLKPIDP